MKKLLTGLLVLALTTSSLLAVGVSAQETDEKNTPEEQIQDAAAAVETVVKDIVGTVSESEESRSASEEAAIENIKKIIEKNISAEKIKEAVGNIARKKRGYVGQVVRITENMFTLRVGDTNTIVSLDEKVLLTDSDGDEIEIETIAVDDWVQVLGFDQVTEFEPRSLTIIDENPFSKEYLTVLGSIAQVEGKTIRIKDRGSETTYEIAVQNDSLIEGAAGTEIDLDMLESDMNCIVVAQKDSDGDFILNRLQLLVTVQEIQDATTSGLLDEDGAN